LKLQTEVNEQNLIDWNDHLEKEKVRA